MKRKQRVKKKQPSAAAEARYRKRSDAIAAVRRGERMGDVARVLGIGLSTLFRWLADYRDGGEDALRDGPRPGRPRKVSAEVMQWLYDAVTMGDPRQYQFTFCLWTLGIIRTMLKREWGIELSKSSVSRMMGYLGLSAQHALYRSYKQDKKKVNSYLKRRFPQIRRLARGRGAVIYFVDEASVRADEHRGTTWGKIGETPVVEDTGDRYGVNLISAVSSRGDMKFQAFEGTMDEGKFLEFLACLLKDTGKPIIVIADNASYHTSDLVRKCAETSGSLVSLFFLPPYSPELNPDEQVWNQTKARVGKMFIETKEQLLDAVKKVLKSIQASTDLIRSFFQLKDTKYAADSC
jgi:transposase